MTERIATPKRTREIIEANRFFFKKSFGQNFLIDSNILENIVERAGITKEDVVLEIGPGIGSMTQVLAEHAKRVITVEIDKNLIPILNETLSGYDNITILNQDIMKAELSEICETYGEGRPIKVVANLPYYIATPIVAEFVKRKELFSSVTVMVQKEVAKRMQAQPGSKEYGILSVAAAYYSEAEILLLAPPSCFMPAPKVDSAVISLTLLPAPRVVVTDEAFFMRVVGFAFGQRRKTLMNCLFHQKELGLSKEAIAALFLELGIPEKARGETLSLEMFASLANALYAMGNKKNSH